MEESDTEKRISYEQAESRDDLQMHYYPLKLLATFLTSLNLTLNCALHRVSKTPCKRNTSLHSLHF